MQRTWANRFVLHVEIAHSGWQLRWHSGPTWISNTKCHCFSLHVPGAETKMDLLPWTCFVHSLLPSLIVLPTCTWLKGSHGSWRPLCAPLFFGALWFFLLSLAQSFLSKIHTEGSTYFPHTFTWMLFRYPQIILSSVEYVIFCTLTSLFPFLH
jgi:hypothetical protein